MSEVTVNEHSQIISNMSWKNCCIFYCLLVDFKIDITEGQVSINATLATSTVQTSVRRTSTVVNRASSVQIISPTHASTIMLRATSTVAPPVPTPTPTPPPLPTPPPVPTKKPTPPSKRTYGFIVNLGNFPWKDEYKNPLLFMENYNIFVTQEMKALFKNGSFPDLKKVKIADPGEILGNDAGKVRTKFLVTFDAVPPQGSKEPEMYFRLNNFQKGSKYKYYAVPSSIKVEESVQGVDFGNWTLKGEIPKSCCGESVYQTRTCNGLSADSCDGLHLNRTFPCHLKYPITCSGKERKFSFNITLGKVWKDGYKDLSSLESKELVTKLTTGEGSLLEEVKNIFKNSSTGYKAVDSNSFEMSQDNGKVRVSFTVLFSEPPSNPDDPEAVFRFKTENGKLGNFEIDTKSIQIEESVPGFTFEPWINKDQDGCNKCCGGQLQQTRTCQSKMGQCPDAQLTRSIRCGHVCEEVKCADSSKTVPYVLGILICIFASSFAWI